MLVCGIDEVGRGALAGPLIAVAALFDSSASYQLEFSPIPGLNDSKKLTVKKRRRLFHEILRYECLVDFGVGETSVQEIDKFGINWANNIAFKRAIFDLKKMPEYILIDGINLIKGFDVPMNQICMPQADGKLWPVAAASILAKTIRDDYMAELGSSYPEYKWDSNAGYGSAAHKAALKEKGACGLHRAKFVEGLL